MQSTRALHGHQSASALRPMHQTACGAEICGQYSPAVLCLRPLATLVDKEALSTSTNRQRSPAGLPPGVRLSTCSRTRAAPLSHSCLPGTAYTAARGWRRRVRPRTPSWSRRRAARCWARGRSLTASRPWEALSHALEAQVHCMIDDDDRLMSDVADRAPRGFEYR